MCRLNFNGNVDCLDSDCRRRFFVDFKKKLKRPFCIFENIQTCSDSLCLMTYCRVGRKIGSLSKCASHQESESLSESGGWQQVEQGSEPMQKRKLSAALNFARTWRRSMAEAQMVRKAMSTHGPISRVYIWFSGVRST